jgi:hypothetical protein
VYLHKACGLLLFFQLDYQLILDKEEGALRKETLSSLEMVNETYHGIPYSSDKRIEFLLCQSCFWCASYFNFDELSIISCPLCHSDHIEQLPVSNR